MNFIVMAFYFNKLYCLYLKTFLINVSRFPVKKTEKKNGKTNFFCQKTVSLIFGHFDGELYRTKKFSVNLVCFFDFLELISREDGVLLAMIAAN